MKLRKKERERRKERKKEGTTDRVGMASKAWPVFSLSPPKADCFLQSNEALLVLAQTMREASCWEMDGTLKRRESL